MNTATDTNGGGARRAGQAARRKTPWPLVVVAALFVVVPFLAWYGTWFGRGLSDEKIDEYLRESGNPRHVQHALSQVAERVERREPGVERWYPLVAEAAGNGVADVRMTAAWVMGLEHGREEFHATLLRLLEDPEPIVRRNAALALVRFGDSRCRDVLRSMLRPFSIHSPASGTALTVLTEGAHVRRDSMLARLRLGGSQTEDVRAPLPGKILKASVSEGEAVAAGAEMFLLSPEPEHVRDALIGLYYFGEADDLPELERYAAGVAGMPEEVKRQAALTAEAVRRRSSQGT